MDLFNFELTDNEQEQLGELRSEINVARALLHHRLERGMSQAELAQRAKTTQARVSEVEAMKGDPKLSTLSRIAVALGCMIDMVPVAPPAALVTTTDSFFNFDVVFDATDHGTEVVYTSPNSENTVQMEQKVAA